MKTRLFFGSLPESFGTDELSDLCRQHGELRKAVVVCDPAGRSRGFGFAEYKTSKDAESALAALNGCQVCGKQIGVAWARPRPRKGNYHE